MTEKNTYETDNHNTFGGRIYACDFDTEHCRGNMVNRILSDWRFDEQCRINSINRERGGKADAI